VLWEYGEERFSRRIADFIARARAERPIETTVELADIVRQAIPAKFRNEPQHPARRTFQAFVLKSTANCAGWTARSSPPAICCKKAEECV
jgi:16S rRNA C1402 N4-methylase RsmH